MANGFFARSHLTYTASASTSGLDTPAANVSTLNIQQVWRSTTTSGTQYVQLDLGSSLALRVWQLEQPNFSTVTVRSSDDPTFGSGVTEHGAFTVFLDDKLEDPTFWRRHRTQEIATVVSDRYWRFVCSSVLLSDTAYQIGRILVWNSIEPLSRNPTHWDWQRDEPCTVLDYEGGGFETNSNGITRMRVTLDAQGGWVEKNRSTRETIEQLTRILGTGFGRPFVVGFNRGDETEGYLLARTVPGGFRESHVVYEGAPIVLREVV
jgi:hypothetical protein